MIQLFSSAAKRSTARMVSWLRHGDTRSELEVMLDTLLADGVDLTKPDANGNAPLHLAVKVVLGQMGRDGPSRSSAHLHAEKALPTIAELEDRLDQLLSRLPASALADAQQLHNKDGYTPFHVAVHAGSERVCNLLLTAGAPICAYTLKKVSWMPPDGAIPFWVNRSKTGIQFGRATDQTALHLALSLLVQDDSVESPDVSLVRFLIDNGCDVNALDCWGRTPLHMAVTAGLHEIVDYLGSTGKCRKSAGQNSAMIHLAVVHKDARMVKTLLAHGARVDDRGQYAKIDGWTPLCLAARQGAVDVAKVLLSAGADLNATSSNGKSALEIAIINSKRKDCQSVHEVLQTEMVFSVLEIAFRRPASGSAVVVNS